MFSADGETKLNWNKKPQPKRELNVHKNSVARSSWYIDWDWLTRTKADSVGCEHENSEI